MTLPRPLAAALSLVVVAPTLAAAPATITVDVGRPGAAIPPTFYGLMTEEINHAYDGGLFAELVQNRTFQDDAKRPAHWSTVLGARMRMDGGDPVNGALPVSLRVDFRFVAGRGGGPLDSGVANDGFWGVPVRPDTTYTASFFAKAGDGFTGPVTASLVVDGGVRAVQALQVARATTKAITSDWQRYTVTLTTGHNTPTTADAKFMLTANSNGCCWFSLVSLFPPTYQDVPGGLRPDLMKLMADLHPAFIRLPGGNYLEGDTFATRFNWKQMIGPAEQRPGHMGCWSYRSSDGFGLPEYLLWCKQLGAEPVLALFAGYTLNHDHVSAGADLRPFVDDALEEIEYVAGPADSAWGKRRAADGFPEPFHLTYVEVGNEDGFDPSGSYDGRFARFADAVRARYPKLKVIATEPVKSGHPDLVDDHFYRSARQMATDWTHYDARTAGSPPVFCGEWASQEGRPTPDLNAALGDAVWLMGLERNADRVPIECYAPLLVNVNPGAWQWPTNLIGYDALASFGSPSYYAQALFGQNKGDVVLPVTTDVATTQPADPAVRGAVGVGVWHTAAEFADVTATAPDGHPLLASDPTRSTDGWRFTGDKWTEADGALRPAAADGETWAVTGDPAWGNYTLHLRARKAAGREGFLVLYHVADGDRYRWWNVGGWGDTRTQCEATDGDARQAFGPASDFKVQAGQWYDLRLDVSGRHVRGFVDGQLVTDATEPMTPARPTLFASATAVTATHEVILKVVNASADAVDATVNLWGAASVTPAAKAYVLAGDPKDVNTVGDPTKVAPKVEQVTDAAATFRRTFPPHSLTLLRVTAPPR